MLKNFTALIILSILFILTFPYCQQLLHLLLQGYDQLLNGLNKIIDASLRGKIFTMSIMGSAIIKSFLLIMIPLIITLILKLIFRSNKNNAKNIIIIYITWIIWIVLVAGLAAR